MPANNKSPIFHSVSEPQRPASTKDDNILAQEVAKQPSPLFIVMTAAGNWKYMAFANYFAMYFLMIMVIVGDTFNLWNFQIDQAVLATFVGATIGSTIPLYLQFRIGQKSN